AVRKALSPAFWSCCQPLPCLLIEHVDHGRLDGKTDSIAWIHLRPAVRHEHDLRFSGLQQELGFGAGGLDDRDLGWYCGRRLGIGERKMLRPDAVRHTLSLRACRRAKRPA